LLLFFFSLSNNNRIVVCFHWVCSELVVIKVNSAYNLKE